MMQQNSISAASVGDILQNLKSMTIGKTDNKYPEPEKINVATKSPEVKLPKSDSLPNSAATDQTPPKVFLGPFSASSSRSGHNSPEVDSFTFKSPPAPLFTPAKVPITLFSNSATNNLFTEPKNSPLASLSNKNNSHLQAGFADVLERSKKVEQQINLGPFSVKTESIPSND
jgi:hypothetical protein